VAIRKQAHGLPLNITILQVLCFATVCAHHPLLLQDDLGKIALIRQFLKNVFSELPHFYQQVPANT
jgi:hypothetical protein